MTRITYIYPHQTHTTQKMNLRNEKTKTYHFHCPCCACSAVIVDGLEHYSAIKTPHDLVRPCNWQHTKWASDDRSWIGAYAGSLLISPACYRRHIPPLDSTNPHATPKFSITMCNHVETTQMTKLIANYNLRYKTRLINSLGEINTSQFYALAKVLFS